MLFLHCTLWQSSQSHHCLLISFRAKNAFNHYLPASETNTKWHGSQSAIFPSSRTPMNVFLYLFVQVKKKCSPRRREASVHSRKIASKGWMSGLAENKVNKSEVQESPPSAKQNMEHDKVNCHVWCAESAHNSISQSYSNTTFFLHLFLLHLEFDITITIILSFWLMTLSVEWRLRHRRLHVRICECSAQGLCQQVSCK